MDISPNKLDCLDADTDDAALAHHLVKAIGRASGAEGYFKKSEFLALVYKAIREHLPPRLADRWTERRIRTLWDRESDNIKFREMVQLAKVEAAETKVRADLREARRSHAAFIAETARIAEFLERQDEDFHRHQVAAMRQATGAGRSEPSNSCDQAGRVDRAGTEER